MNAKHTPGPWVTYLNTMDDVVVRKMNEAGYEQCVIARGANYKNARLIAAAPELLEALIELADCGAEAWGEDRPCVRIARDAIAKATGGKA